MSEDKLQYKFQETLMSGRWKVRQFDLPNAKEYLWDIENISMACISSVHALEMNRFFEEACQMIANSIYLFQQGFFDAAFYSLRQSIELSLGAPFLLANPDRMKEWRRLEPGFESGHMTKHLRENEPIFKEIREKLHCFFENIRRVQKKTNKYVHKQGYKSFYVMQRYSWSDKREAKVYNQIVSDFETTLCCAIGAVAVYRLTIDPLPVLFMDDDIMMRTGDIMTQPYSEKFVDKYIGQDVIEAYKHTKVYRDFRKSFEENEKQNEAVFCNHSLSENRQKPN